MAIKILVPLNRSDYSREILPHIEKLIPTSESQLILFYITRPPRGMSFAVPDPGSDYALESGGEPVDSPAHPIYAHQQEDGIQSEIEVQLLPTMRHLAEVYGTSQEAGYAVSLQVCFGENVVDEIVRIVRKEGIDLVAMSTQAQVGVRRFFFGDIADRVMRRVKVPVLLFHPTV